ncbi:MAG: murein biosynthesis integral membrane protein MurJ [Anaerolineales bacterium]|nr:murein biosynthesis integral membrane protein MurJ [Anaerolineales bacterium]
MASIATRQIARAAGTVMAAFVLSNLIGLLRQVLITNAFGAEAALDSYYAAARLPELVFSLVAGGALASAFIPTFTGLLETHKRGSAWLLASSVANLITLALVLLCGLAWVFAEPLAAQVLVPDFAPAQQALTAELLRIQLITPILFGISGLLMGILNAHQSFLLPALAPSMNWVGVIFGVLFLAPSLGVHGLAWGSVIGAGLHLAVQLPGLVRLKGHYSPTLGLGLPDVREVARLMGPRLLGQAAVQINFVVNTIIASGLPAGSLTAITIAFQVMTMPQIVIAQAIAIAALPTFSAQFASGRIAELRTALASTLRGVVLLSLPATVGLVLLRGPLVALLFQRGEFGGRDTELVAWALLWYAAGLVGHSVVEIASRAFYALHDTRTPVMIGVGAMALNAILSLVLPGVFLRWGWLPHGGLALANSAATFLEMLALLWLMGRRLGGLEPGRLWVGLGQASLASLAMGLGLWVWLGQAAAWPFWLQAAGGVTIGLGLFTGAAWLLRVPELNEALAAVRRRLGRAG